MSEKKTIVENIEIDAGLGDGNLFEKFKTAWLQVPDEHKEDAYIWDDHISYNREETDEEFNLRVQAEKAEQEHQDRINELKRNSHLVKELDERLAVISERWENLKTGQFMEVRGSVPMPDGRIASVQINVTAREQVKSDDS